MRVVITGTSDGIGQVTAIKFLTAGHEVIGIDKNEYTIQHPNYTHIRCDIFYNKLPDIKNVDILINNAGIQTEKWFNKRKGEINFEDIEVNLKGTMLVTEKYAIQPHIKAVVNVASASAHSGAEFPTYSASKGGMLAYTKNVALRIAKYNATCNSISPGGVLTDLNKHIMEDKKLWNAVMKETLIPRWAYPEEMAEWIYFIAVVNKSMTAQDILIDNGEAAKSNFIW